MTASVCRSSARCGLRLARVGRGDRSAQPCSADCALQRRFGGEKTIPERGKVRIPELIERLVQLHEVTGKKDDAASKAVQK
jgi:hypothetical protein